MDPYSFPPVAAVLELARSLVEGLVRLVEPFAGTSSTALAVVLVTVAVRTCLLPVGVSQMRAERTRRRLAPLIAELRRRHSSRPDLLQQKLLELYAREKASPLAGCLPLVAQAPVLSIVYGLFALPAIGGQANTLLAARLGDAALGSSLMTAVQGGAGWPALAVYLGLLAIVAAVAWLTRRATVKNGDPALHDGASKLPGALSFAPFVTVVVAALVPLAATIYLTVTCVWTLSERTILLRMMMPG